MRYHAPLRRLFMNTPQVMFKNNEQAAQALSAHLQHLFSRTNAFTVRPFNYFSPEFSVWWLVPKKEWPAFRHSKISLQVSPISPSETGKQYTGFYIEKGFGAEVSSIPNVPKKYLMQTDWYWHEFVKQSTVGAIDEIAANVAEVSSCP